LRDIHVLNRDGEFSEPTDVAVSGGRVENVGSRGKSSENRSFDCSDLWLMPGVFDCHAHLGCFTDDVLAMMEMDVTQWTLEVARNARFLLESGVTTVRDVATATPGIREGMNAGAVPGPQLFVSGPMLSQTGGHGDGFIPSTGTDAIGGFLTPDFQGRPPYLVDGEDDVRLTVRKLLRSGVDWVKICTTGGLLSSGLDHPRKPEMTDLEIETAVFEAGRAGVPVAAHAYGGSGIDSAVAAGVRSIEHGIFLSEEQAARMAEAGCWLVPTLSVFYELEELGRKGLISQSATDRVAEIMPSVGEAVAIARSAGVRMALGTDRVEQGPNLREIKLMRDSGLTEREALLAATSGGAELCGVTDRGRIEAGMVFDAIVLDRDPSDLEVFAEDRPVTGVFQNGIAVVQHERLGRNRRTVA
jgi:imidazolonepropionase-like amidohydrolase